MLIPQNSGNISLDPLTWIPRSSRAGSWSMMTRKWQESRWLLGKPASLPSKTELNEDALGHTSRMEDSEHEFDEFDESEDEDVTTAVRHTRVVQRI